MRSAQKDDKQNQVGEKCGAFLLTVAGVRLRHSAE